MLLQTDVCLPSQGPGVLPAAGFEPYLLNAVREHIISTLMAANTVTDTKWLEKHVKGSV
jgi:hypothetical protein